MTALVQNLFCRSWMMNITGLGVSLLEHLYNMVNWKTSRMKWSDEVSTYWVLVKCSCHMLEKSVKINMESFTQNCGGGVWRRSWHHFRSHTTTVHYCIDIIKWIYYCNQIIKTFREFTCNLHQVGRAWKKKARH